MQYRVLIEVYGAFSACSSVKKWVGVEAENPAQAIRKAGMTVVQELEKKEKEQLKTENN